MTTKNGLAIGAVAVAATLAVVLLAGSVLAQTGTWTPGMMGGGMGSMGGMMGSMGGMMSSGTTGDMDAMHASCASGNMSAENMTAMHAAMHG